MIKNELAAAVVVAAICLGVWALMRLFVYVCTATFVVVQA